MPRPIELTVSISALSHNLAVARRAAPGSRVWAVVKANAYGHGLDVAQQGFATADGVALVEFDAAQRLRESGWTKPILMLEGPFDISDVQLAMHQNLTLVLHSLAQVPMIEALPPHSRPAVYLKFNSGMHRLGMNAADLRSAHARLSQADAAGRPTLMTHFASADMPGGADQALAAFVHATEGLSGPRSTSNSAAVFDLPAAHGDWIRPGVMLYGATPFSGRTAASLGLHAAMRLSTRLIAVQSLQAGDRVGYGGTFVAPGPMRIGVLACGYADGYPRHAPTGTPVLVAGVRTRTIGRVAMDMMMVDLSAVPEAGVGAEVELWGPALPVDEVAEAAGTIGYELLCAIAPRVPRRTVI